MVKRRRSEYLHFRTKLRALSFEVVESTGRTGSLVTESIPVLHGIDGRILKVSTEVRTSFDPHGPFLLRASYESSYISPEVIVPEDVTPELLNDLSRSARREHVLLIGLLTKFHSGTPLVLSSQLDESSE